MKSLQAGFKHALFAILIVFLSLSGCRDRDSVKVTRGNGETQTVSGAEAVVCIFTLGLACPARPTDPYADNPPVATPSTPEGISAVAASNGIAEIYLSWQAVTGERPVTGYRIYRDGSLISDSAAAAYTDSLLDANRNYCYTVVAVDESLNQSANSAEACATTSWHIATVEADIREARPSIAVDALGQVHLAYVGFDPDGTREIAYANGLSGSWRSETVGEENGVFTDAPAIVVDAAGCVHIGTADKYSTNAIGSWQAESFEAHNFPAMALDSRGFVHALSAGPDGALNHTSNSGGSWSSESIGSGWWQQSALVIDDDDSVHVVYYDYPERQLVYASNAGGSWLGEVIAVDFAPIWRLDLAVDARRRLHVSYQTKPAVDTASLPAPGGGQGLGYASNAEGHWQRAIIDSGDSVGAGSSIAVDAQGHVHISYTDRRQDELKYATNSSGDWKLQTIARGDAVDSECELLDELCGVTAIGIDRQGKVHVAYHNSDQVLYITNR